MIASELAEHDGGRVGVIDSERGSSAAYSEGKPFDFDMLTLDEKSPDAYTRALLIAQDAGFSAVVIDSASHEWRGTQRLADQVGKQRQNNTWSGWGVARPAHELFMETLIAMPSHVIATYRSKQETEQYKDENNRTKVRKLGLAPVASEDTDFEFDVWGSIDHDTHTVIISKSRIDTIPIHSEWPLGSGLADAYLSWIDGADYEAPAPSEAMVRAAVMEEIKQAGVKNRDVAVAAGEDGIMSYVKEHGLPALIDAARAAAEHAGQPVSAQAQKASSNHAPGWKASLDEALRRDGVSRERLAQHLGVQTATIREINEWLDRNPALDVRDLVRAAATDPSLEPLPSYPNTDPEEVLP